MQARQEHYISPLHIIKNINVLLYEDKRILNKEYIIYLSELKNAVLQLEQETRELFNSYKHKKWHDDEHLNENKDLLNNVYIQVISKLSVLIDKNQKKLNNAKIESGLHKRFEQIHADLIALSELIKIQQTTQIANLTNDVDLALMYSLYQLLQINYVASRQDADPLFGGYIKNGKPILGEGICAGKAIKWIYVCSQEGSPKYPLYVEEGAHWHQDEQTKFKDQCAVKVKGALILEFFLQLPKVLEVGALYYIQIASPEGGHALNVRKRHDSVIEFHDPNTGNTFTLDETRNLMALLLGISHYVLFSGFTHASLFEANVRDEVSERTYYPDRHTLEKPVTKIVTEDHELKLIATINKFLKRAYLNSNTNSDTADDYFLLLLPLVIQSLNYKNALVELQKILAVKKLSTLQKKLKAQLDERLELVDKDEFAKAMSQKNDVLKSYNAQQDLLREKINDLRSEAAVLLKSKDMKTDAAKWSRMSVLTQRMSTFSNLLKRVVQTKVPTILTANPLTDVVQFVKNTVSKVKRFFGKKEEATQEAQQSEPSNLLAEITAEVDKDQAIDSSQRTKLQLQLNSLIQLITALLTRFKNQHEEDLAASGLSFYQLLNYKAKYQLRERVLTQLQRSLAELQNRVLIDYSKEEESKSLEGFTQSFAQLIPFSEDEKLLLESNSAASPQKVVDRIEQWLEKQIGEELLQQEKLQISAPESLRTLRADHQRLLRSLTLLIDYLQELNIELKAQIKINKKDETIERAHTLFCQYMSIYHCLENLKKTKDSLAHLNFHTEKTMNENRAHMHKITQVYQVFFTHNFQLHEDYKSLVKGEVTRFTILKQEEISECSAWYQGLHQLNSSLTHLLPQAAHNPNTFWGTENTPAQGSVQTAIRRDYQRFLQSSALQVAGMVKAICWNPYYLIECFVNEGYTAFLQTFVKRHQCDLPWLLNLQSPTRSKDACIWPLFARQVRWSKCSELQRLVELSNRCEQLVKDGDLLPTDTGELALIPRNTVLSINQAAKQRLSPFILSNCITDKTQFNQKLTNAATHFTHWLMQPRSNANSLNGLLLFRLEEWNAISLMQNDIAGLRSNLNRHLLLLEKAFEEVGVDDSYKKRLQELKGYYEQPSLLFSVTLLYHFMNYINDIVEVYDSGSISLSPRYMDIIREKKNTQEQLTKAFISL